MFGYDDELNKIIQAKLADAKVYVQMSLDRSQAGGVHEKKILAQWQYDAFGNSIAIGTSSVQTRAVLDLNHDFMLKHMVGTKLDVAKLVATGQSAASPPLPPAPASRSADAAPRQPGA